jgi:hypothetical protein
MRKKQIEEEKMNLAYKQLQAEAKLTKGIVHDYKLWLLKNSILFTTVNKKESMDVMEKCDCQVKQCFYNCWRALSINQNYKYYEGTVMTKAIPIPLEHSWLVNKNNEIIDPTLIIDIPKEKIVNRLGDEYFGVEIPKEFCYKMGFKIRKSGPYLFDYFREITNVR